MKLERKESSETSALKAQTPGDYPKKIQYGKITNLAVPSVVTVAVYKVIIDAKKA